jgi:hypothetical protein
VDGAFGSMGADGQAEREEHDRDEFFSFWRSLLSARRRSMRSGTGLNSPRRLHSGISRKKPK